MLNNGGSVFPRCGVATMNSQLYFSMYISGVISFAKFVMGDTFLFTKGLLF